MSFRGPLGPNRTVRCKRHGAEDQKPVNPFAQNEPLTDAELDRLANFLKGCKSGKAMAVEQLDGFFAALTLGPEVVMPSEYYPEVFGGEMSETGEFGKRVLS
jgi:Uncharacterised protein family (UPF0149)